MRIAVIGLLVASCAAVLAQTQPEFIIPEFLTPQYTAPENAPSSVVIAGKDEPGERLVVAGRTLDGNKSVAGVSLFVFHADAKGQYASDTDDNRVAEYNPRLHGSL